MNERIRKATIYNFVKVGNGRLALNHRPGRSDFRRLRELGCTHIVTLLKESEQAERIGKMTKNSGLEWIWLPVPDGKYPEGEVHDLLLEAMPKLSKLLDDGNSLFIHCSAGIHRTGTVSYGLLRWRGMNEKQAMQLIHGIRKETAEGMMDKRKRWGNENARQTVSQEKSWIHSVKELLNRLITKLFKRR